MWPLFPLVIEGLLRIALASSLAAGIFVSWKLGFVVLFGFGAFCRVKQAFQGPRTKPAGFCARESHQMRVSAAATAAKKSAPGPLRMFKATPSNTFRPQQIKNREDSQSRLDLSGFVHVLQVNKEELWCDIEASATFETFVDATLAAGVAPLVVPELRTITVGGAIVGIGIESSSFRHGFFHEGLIEADILLASGEVVTAKPECEYADLFKAVPNSLGSFGYLLRLRMRVQPSEPIVMIKKVWCDSPEGLVKCLEDACQQKEHDFVDAVALSDVGGMLITASFVNEMPTGFQMKEYGLWPVFYKSLLNEGVEYLPALNYFWRWDADWFWCTQIFPGLTFWFVRWLCGPEMLRSDNYKVFNDAVISTVLEPLGLNKDEELVIQDIEIPLNRSADWIRQFLRACPSREIGKIKLSQAGSQQKTVPIWLCPVKGTASPLMPMDSTKMYINFGFWDACEGKQTVGGLKAGKINKALEQLVIQFEGKKTLYSSVFFSEDEFYEQYNGKHYFMLKEKYDPKTRLRHWYERVSKA
jgi:FAD/FMN-containing dehydrogenase